MAFRECSPLIRLNDQLQVQMWLNAWISGVASLTHRSNAFPLTDMRPKLLRNADCIEVSVEKRRVRLLFALGQRLRHRAYHACPIAERRAPSRSDQATAGRENGGSHRGQQVQPIVLTVKPRSAEMTMAAFVGANSVIHRQHISPGPLQGCLLDDAPGGKRRDLGSRLELRSSIAVLRLLANTRLGKLFVAWFAGSGRACHECVQRERDGRQRAETQVRTKRRGKQNHEDAFSLGTPRARWKSFQVSSSHTYKRGLCYHAALVRVYRRLVRPLLFLLQAETAHRWAMAFLAVLSRLRAGLWLLERLFAYRDRVLNVRAMGLDFENPVGLAAGLDKNAEAFDAFGAMGFGLVEVGTLTGEAQPGNEKPRLFRLPQDRALINRMGFNNCGAERAARHLARRRYGGMRLGANIGRTKRVDNAAALSDYAKSARALAPYVDYLVINVSSPNTPGLRALQEKSSLAPLLLHVRKVLDEVVTDRHVPLLVKVAPDLDDADIDAVADVALELGLDGIIATNTTIARQGLSTPDAAVAACGAGGLSGPPVAERALHVLCRLRERVGSRITLVASGGIETGDDAFARIAAGASLVQVYTALIYEGPGLVSAITRQLAQRLRTEGFASVSEAIGSAAVPSGAGHQPSNSSIAARTR